MKRNNPPGSHPRGSSCFRSPAKFTPTPSPCPHSGKANIQKILPVACGIKGYVGSERTFPIPADLQRCPFCIPSHRLRCHGFYARWAVTDTGMQRTWVRRLLCPATGRTVSLLPDFLVPRKLFVAAVIATFLHAFVWLAHSLAAAAGAATGIRPSRQKGRFWCRAVLARAESIRTYAAGLPATAPDTLTAPPATDTLRHDLHTLLGPVLAGAPDLAHTFTDHCRRMHDAYGQALV